MRGTFLTPLAERLPATVPFVGPEAQERALGHPFRARIGANESVFGPSPAAVAAMCEAAAEVWKYGDSTSHDLRATLAQRHGAGPENVVVGEGIDGLLGYLVRLTIEEGDPVVTSLGAYPTFNYHVAGFGGLLHAVPYRNDHEDVEGLLATAAQTGALLVYLANPDNPMGSWHDAETVSRMVERLPEGTLLVLDEAYAEFAPIPVSPSFDPVERRVLRLRTFSKAYGMAGARIGYALGHADLIGAFEKVRNHFGVNRIAQAGAKAALDDADWLRHVLARTAQSRERIGVIAAAHGLTALSSATNFVAVDCGGAAERAGGVVRALAERGVFVRMPFASPGNRCIRIGAGTPADLDLFEAALPEALAAAPA